MILDRFRIDGRVALVTGAGKGIGAGCAIGLAEAGETLKQLAREATNRPVQEQIRGSLQRLELLAQDDKEIATLEQ